MLVKLVHPMNSNTLKRAFNTGFVGGDCCTLDTNVVLQDGFSSLNGNSVIGGITIFNAQVEVLDIDI